MYIKQLYGGKINRNAHIVKLITGKYAIETNTGKGKKWKSMLISRTLTRKTPLSIGWLITVIGQNKSPATACNSDQNRKETRQ